MSDEPTPEQRQHIRQQLMDEETIKLIRDTVDQLQRLGDRLESHLTSDIELEATLEPGLDVDDTANSPPNKAP